MQFSLSTHPELAQIGCKALIIEGQPQDDSWYSISLKPGEITITKEELIGKGDFAVVETVAKRFNDKIGK